MSALVPTWTMSGMADASLAWLATLLTRHRRMPQSWTEDSRLALEERILAAQTEIVAMQRSLAMQKQAMDAAQSVRRTQAGPRSAAHGAQPSDTGVKLDLPLDDEGLSCYADTEPMPYLDTWPRPAPEATGRK